ncbi:hypothetical protein BYT27DRAFT_7217725 [Phlegmacium glaucopus]|nr:hypothetical protein BYT27DRAFT_7217725 [Phlegmacium glaucopus]
MTKDSKNYEEKVVQEAVKDSSSFKEYSKKKGSIATSAKFLKFLKTQQGVEELGNLDGKEGEPGAANNNFSKTIIVPVAIPGCGSSHTQSDDVHAKKPASIFIKKVVDLLPKDDVVIADKNNHLKEHRQSLGDATSKFSHPFVSLLSIGLLIGPALQYIGSSVIVSKNVAMVIKLYAPTKSHKEVTWMFINSTQELTPSETRRIGMRECIGIADEKIREALGVVKDHAPAVKKPDYPKEKKFDVRYYGLLPEVDLEELLDPVLANESKAFKFWMKLKTDNRVTKRPHVTINTNYGIDALLKGKLSNVVWDGHVMAITVEDFDLEVSSGGDDDDEGQEGHEFVSKLLYDVRERLHITVGTKSGNVPAVEAKAMVQEWRKNRNADNNIKSIKLDDLIVYGRIKGLMS